jgi:predicted small secreted protein
MFKRLTATLMAALFMVGALSVLGGCNTVAGAGKDIEKGGKAIKDEANEKR